MLNKYPLWKYLLIVFVLLLGLFYAAPNLYTPDPALQITGESSAQLIDDKTLGKALTALDQAGIKHFGETIDADGRNALLRLSDVRAAADGAGYGRPRPGRWLYRGTQPGAHHPGLAQQLWRTAHEVGARPQRRGALRAGSGYGCRQSSAAWNIYFNATKRALREQRIRGFVTQNPQGAIEARFQTEAVREQARELIAKDSPELLIERVDEGDSWNLVATMSERTRKEIADYSVSQNLTTLRNRVNELGVSEPLVQRQGQNRIVVELPGIQDTAEAKRILGKVANLEFRLVANMDAAASDKQRFEYRSADREGASEWLERDVIITGERVSNAQASFDQNGQPNVQISLDSEGGTLMSRATRNNIKRRMGVLFIERKYRTRYEVGADGAEVVVKVPYDEKKLLTAPVIQSALGAQFQITGLDSQPEASELALMLRAGALAAPINFVEERTIGPSLGAENIRQGLQSSYYGLAFVVLFMVVVLPIFRCGGHCCAGLQHGAAGGGDVHAWGNADAAGNRRYRVNDGYGGRCQRVDFLANTGGVSQGSRTTNGDSRGI